jgi:hypothetical protein
VESDTGEGVPKFYFFKEAACDIVSIVFMGQYSTSRLGNWLAYFASNLLLTSLGAIK